MPDIKMKKWQALKQSFLNSRLRLERARQHTLTAVKQYVGKNYLDNGAEIDVPVNFLELAVGIYKRQLAPTNPQSLITSGFQELKAFSLNFQAVLNHDIREIDLANTLDDAVQQAMFGLVNVRIGMTTTAEAGLRGVLHDPGQMFVDVVDPDDWVHDMGAKNWERVQYMGNRYEVPYEKAMDTVFKGKDLKPSDQTLFNESGDERTGSISSRGLSEEDRFEDVLELWDLFLPCDNVVVTFQSNREGGFDETKGPIATNEWKGPERGPYRRLCFNKVPSQTYPLPPTALLIDLHNFGNLLFNKIADQSSRQKDVTAFKGTAEDDARRLMNAGDGDVIRMDGDPRDVAQFKSGGIDQASLAMFLQVKDTFFTFGGNLDALGGLSPQSETLGQDELISSAASQRIADWGQRSMTFTQEIMQDLADYRWHNPFPKANVFREIKGLSRRLPVKFDNSLREGDLRDYLVTVDVFSLKNRTPEQRLQTIVQTVRDIFLPLAPIMQQQGNEINVKGLAEIIARYSNTPEIAEVITNIDPATMALMAEGGGGDGTRQSPNTTRTNVRVNRPGATRGGKDDAMTKLLLGGGVQDAERQAIGSPTG